jgi:hypothetical protein
MFGVPQSNWKISCLPMNSANRANQDIDFGLATKYRSAECKSMTEKVGTIYTITSVLQGVHTSKCDLVSPCKFIQMFTL